MHLQFRTHAAALLKLRAAHEACPANATVRRIARAVYIFMPSMRRVAYRGNMPTTVAIMLVTSAIVTGVALHGRGRWY
jgi:hypothetical protein